MDGVIEQFKGWQHERVDNFIASLNKHRHRIVNDIQIGWIVIHDQDSL